MSESSATQTDPSVAPSTVPSTDASSIDPECPNKYPGWDTVTVPVFPPNQDMTLRRVDSSMLCPPAPPRQHPMIGFHKELVAAAPTCEVHDGTNSFFLDSEELNVPTSDAHLYEKEIRAIALERGNNFRIRFEYDEMEEPRLLHDIINMKEFRSVAYRVENKRHSKLLLVDLIINARALGQKTSTLFGVVLYLNRDNVRGQILRGSLIKAARDFFMKKEYYLRGTLKLPTKIYKTAISSRKRARATSNAEEE